MRAAVLNTARAALLAGPTALAFFSGGYFDGPRAWAGLLAWALVAVADVVRSAPGDDDRIVAGAGRTRRRSPRGRCCRSPGLPSLAAPTTPAR